jgi:hypothetical protein
MDKKETFSQIFARLIPIRSAAKRRAARLRKFENVNRTIREMPANLELNRINRKSSDDFRLTKDNRVVCKRDDDGSAV